MHTTSEFLPDGSDWVAFLRGPIVLAAAPDTLSQPNLVADGSRMGHVASGALLPLTEAPLVTGTKADLASKLVPDQSAFLTFNAENVIYQPKYKGLKLVPFYTLAEKRYVVYFPYSSLEMLPERAKAIQFAENEKIKLEEETVDLVNTGEQQPESEHDFKGEHTDNGTYQERHFRNGTGWFSYTLMNKRLKASKIRLTFYGKEKNRNFSILVNNTLLEKVKLDGGKENTFYTLEYNIPQKLLTAKLELKFEAEKGSAIANVYELRLLK